MNYVPREKGPKLVTRKLLVIPTRACMCFGLYKDALGTGREWLQCHCGSWICDKCVVERDIHGAIKICSLC